MTEHTDHSSLPFADVTVVIPAYNAEQTLARAVASVAAQTLPPRDVIVIDDASTDRTEALARELAERYAPLRLSVLRLATNDGPSGARNLGWDQARGRYVAFLDADDSWHPRKLEIQYTWMAAHPDVALSGHRFCESTGEPWGDLVDPDPPVIRLSSFRMLWSTPFSTPSAMVDRQLPTRFPLGQHYAEDAFVWLSIAFGGHGVARIDCPLAAIHKAAFGASGLSDHLWEMEKGELGNFRRLARAGWITYGWVVVLSLWSLAKFLRRGSVPTYVQILGRLKRSWYEGDC